MDYHRYVCRYNSQTAKDAATRITNIFNNAYVKTSTTQQPDRFACLLHLSGTCARLGDLGKVLSVLGLSKASFSSELCLPSLGTSVTLCDLMRRHMVHAGLSSLQLNFERHFTGSKGEADTTNDASSAIPCVVSLSLVHQRFRPGEPLRLQLSVKTLGTEDNSKDRRTIDEELLARVQEGFEALRVPFAIGKVTELTRRGAAFVTAGATFAPCTRVIDVDSICDSGSSSSSSSSSASTSSFGYEHLQPIEAIAFSDDKDGRQAVVEFRWAERDAAEAFHFAKRVVALWLGGCDRAKYVLAGDYGFLLDLLKPLDRATPPSLKQLVAKRVLDNTPLAFLSTPSSSSLLSSSSLMPPHSPRTISSLEGLIPRELVDYTTQQEEVVLLGSSMHFSFECSEQQAKDKKLPAHVVLPFLEHCASMTLRPQPRTLSCDYLDLVKKDDGTFEISARAFKAAIGNADNFYGEALRAERP